MYLATWASTCLFASILFSVSQRKHLSIIKTNHYTSSFSKPLLTQNLYSLYLTISFHSLNNPSISCACLSTIARVRERSSCFFYGIWSFKFFWLNRPFLFFRHKILEPREILFQRSFFVPSITKPKRFSLHQKGLKRGWNKGQGGQGGKSNIFVHKGVDKKTFFTQIPCPPGPLCFKKKLFVPFWRHSVVLSLAKQSRVTDVSVASANVWTPFLALAESIQ